MSSLVSIIIPCYKSATTVADTLDSVLKQTYQNIEVILVNDGSPDNVDEIIQPYIDSNPNFHYIYQDNKGLPGARNTGIKQSKGNYILCLDSDDLIAPTYIERCVQVLDTQPNTKLVYSNGLLFGAQQEKWKFRKYNFRTLLLENIIHASAIMRKSDFLKYGPYDEKLTSYEDWDLWINILKDGGDVFLIPELLFMYRKHEDKSSMTDKMLENHELSRRNREIIYKNHIHLYNKEFGSPTDMLKLIGEQEFIITRYNKKAAKWYRRLLRF